MKRLVVALAGLQLQDPAMKVVLALIDLLTPKWLLIGLAAVAALTACVRDGDVQRLQVAIASANSARSVAEGQLASRIAAEARSVADAVNRARAEEQAMQVKQQEKIDELRRSNAAAAGELDAARQRLRVLVYGIGQPAPGPGGGNLPAGAGLAARALDPAGAEFQAASRGLADGLLQLLAEADAVTRERNTCTAIR